jgi:prepilin-type N-terminal cleavage/methylation domain-containing protein
MSTSERGFTLIEALIATLVLTVGLVATAELLAVSVRMHMLGRNSSTATRLAQDKFEEMMKMNFATNPAISPVTCASALTSNVANCFDTPAGSGYVRRWQVQAGPGGNASLRLVTIRVIPSNPDMRMAGDFSMTTVLRSW